MTPSKPYPLTRLITVTADDIAEGRRGAGGEACPVALALNRATRWRWSVYRAPWRGHVVGCAKALGPIPIDIRLTRSVGVFVRDFDARKPVQPFTFRMYR